MVVAVVVAVAAAVVVVVAVALVAVMVVLDGEGDLASICTCKLIPFLCFFDAKWARCCFLFLHFALHRSQCHLSSSLSLSLPLSLLLISSLSLSLSTSWLPSLRLAESAGADAVDLDVKGVVVVAAVVVVVVATVVVVIIESTFSGLILVFVVPTISKRDPGVGNDELRAFLVSISKCRLVGSVSFTSAWELLLLLSCSLRVVEG